MNREDIIRMAQEAHFNSKTWIDIYKDEITAGDVKGYLEAFAALVASAEREKFCATLRQLHDSYSLASDSNVIRERGQA